VEFAGNPPSGDGGYDQSANCAVSRQTWRCPASFPERNSDELGRVSPRSKRELPELPMPFSKLAVFASHPTPADVRAQKETFPGGKCKKAFFLPKDFQFPQSNRVTMLGIIAVNASCPTLGLHRIGFEIDTSQQTAR
jgi:hypothetical protein